jgi:hypothetical protein
MFFSRNNFVLYCDRCVSLGKTSEDHCSVLFILAFLKLISLEKVGVHLAQTCTLQKRLSGPIPIYTTTICEAKIHVCCSCGIGCLSRRCMIYYFICAQESN